MDKQLINISFPIKETILLSLKETKDEFTKRLLFLTAFMLYRKRKLSIGKAAELAGYNKIEFMERIKDENEFIFDYNDEEIDEIISEGSALSMK